MSLLINGALREQWLESEREDGEFIRQDSQFRHWISADGSAGPSGENGFKAEPGRYHLYISLACPWAHRTLIFRKLKGLEDIISLSAVSPDMGDAGWKFTSAGGEPFAGTTDDGVNGFDFMHQVYTQAKPDYTGIVTVPVLWDRQRHTIVNNESSEIIRMLNSAFDTCGASGPDYYPKALREDIDSINGFIYGNINNGVYRTGFAASQTAYEWAFRHLFDALDELEQRLASQRYLVGTQITEADWRLFTTLLRFDAVYVGHFKCNLRRIADYPNLSGYLRELYQLPGIAETVDFTHIKRHYYYSHTSINPTRIVPLGPRLDLEASHNRQHLQ
ncbi:Glutathione S-transferase, omega [hydrothermal vent metagenome]|uniref:Glutathione S-transferase, omega n=1 Tax=hydrothermal vent metagenome TaxID=652676 RepID=A0A3B1ARQ1_9ZZZZ